MTRHRLTPRLRRSASPLMLLALAFLGGSVACGSPAANPAAVPLEEFPLALAEAYCDAVAECADMFQSAGGFYSNLVLVSPTAMEECLDAEVARFRPVPALRAAVDAGTLAYDPLAARRCVTDIRESCSQLGLDGFPSCREVFQGLVPDGQSCTLSEECGHGSRCDSELLLDICSAGECVPRSPLGAPCYESDECVRPGDVGSTICRTDGGTDTVCVALRQTLGAVAGEACGRVDNDGLERSHVTCAADFFCEDPDHNEVGTCRLPLMRGEPCLFLACKSGSTCSYLDGGPVCRPVRFARTAGARCDDEASYCDHTVRLNCIAGRCAEMAPGTCWTRIHCNDDEYCDFDTCETRFPNGTECDDSGQCASSRCDDYTMTGTGRCMDVVTCG